MRPGEPVYAQVNRDQKKRSRGGGGPEMGGGGYNDYSGAEHGHHWMVQDNGGAVLDTSHASGHTSANNSHNTQGGDSWV